MGYTGLDSGSDDPLAAEVLRRGGALDRESLSAYGEVLGTMGGAAACASFGAAPAAPLCGKLGGMVGRYIVENVPIARGSTMQDLIADTVPMLRRGRAQQLDRVLSLRSYLTLRDAVISELAELRGPGGVEWADRELSARGVPSSDELGMAPDYETHREYVTADLDRCTKESSAAVKMGVAASCGEYNHWLRGYHVPPIAPGQGAIDWHKAAVATFDVPQASRDWIAALDVARGELVPQAKRRVLITQTIGPQLHEATQIGTLRRSTVARDAGVGALFGAGVGAALASVNARGADKRTQIAMGAGIGAGVGALAGAFVGGSDA